MTGPVQVAVIAAVADNGVIGRDNGLPWRLADDLRHFKELTLGKPVVMGRKTFESIGRPLPGRPNIVISRDPAFAAEGVDVVRSVDEGLGLARRLAAAASCCELVVIGGAQIYAAALSCAARLYLTEVHAEVVGDAWMPAIDWARWREVSRDDRPPREGDSHPYSFVVYERDSS